MTNVTPVQKKHEPNDKENYSLISDLGVTFTV